MAWPPTKAWQGIEVHPAAAVFPMLPDGALEELGLSIRNGGLQQQILLWRDNRHLAKGGTANEEEGRLYLIDGRNRLEAMRRVKVSVPSPTDRGRVRLIEAYRRVEDGWEPEEPDPAALVIQLNIHRRHLAPAEKARLGILARTARDPAIPRTSDSLSVGKGGRGNKALTTKVAEDLGIGKDVVREQAAVRADRALNAKVEKGEITPIDAGREIRERKRSGVGPTQPQRASQPQTAVLENLKAAHRSLRRATEALRVSNGLGGESRKTAHGQLAAVKAQAEFLMALTADREDFERDFKNLPNDSGDEAV